MRAVSAGCLFALAACSPDRTGRPPVREEVVASPAERTVAEAAIDIIRGQGALRSHVAGGLLAREHDHFRLAVSRPSAWLALDVPSLRAEVPTAADGAIRLAPDDDRDAFLELTARVAHRAGVVLDNNVVFPAALPDTDVVWALETSRAEELRVLRSASAATEARYTMRLGPNLSVARVSDGHVEVLDAAGRVRLRTERAFAVDAHGTRRDAVVTIEGDELAVRIDPAGLAYPVVLDPAWTTTAAMSRARRFHSAAAVGSSVLVIGGIDGAGGTGSATTTAEIFNGTSWAPTGSMSRARARGSLVGLPSGAALAIGSASNTDASVERWTAGAWTTVAPMSKGRTDNYAYVLPSGKVLVGSGRDSGGGNFNPDAELYDPTSGLWAAAGSAGGTFSPGESVQLSNGDVTLVSARLTKVAIYENSTSAWRTPTYPVVGPVNIGSTLAALDSTRVLMIGGTTTEYVVTTGASIYDVATNTFSTTGSMTSPRQLAVALRLSSGRVLVVGGTDQGREPLATTEVYDPVTRTWSTAGRMLVGRATHTVTALPGGKALVTGGEGPSGALASAEIYQPLANGTVCSGAGECASGVCVDGVCCDRACSGACEQCNQATRVGTCSAMTGAPHVGRTCAPYALCVSGACAATCSTDAGCDANSYCSSGACVPKKDLANRCDRAAQCASGLCVDGWCCNAACGGQCEACDVVGKEGTCWPTTGAPHGARAACAAGDLECGPLCNGTDRTRCNIGSTTKPCSTTACMSGIETHASYCNGAGSCADVPKSCGVYACGATACATSCTSGAECAAGYGCKSGTCAPLDSLGAACADSGTCRDGLFCTDGICCGVAACPAGSACVNKTDGVSCRKKNGTGCATSDECSSGQCVDGVCCESACAGQCQACDVDGSEGKCVAVTGPAHGTRTACATEATNLCASRACNGVDVDSCAGFAKAVECRPAACAGGIATARAVCDGAGSCPVAITTPCNGFACDPSTKMCKKSCSSSADCDDGFACKAGSCERKAGVCSADATEVVATDGTRTGCTPYVCRDDSCVAECATTSDCASGNVCDTALKQCVALPVGEPAESGGCTVSNGASSSSAVSLLAVLGMIVAARARRRSSRAAVIAMLAVAACTPDRSTEARSQRSSSALGAWTDAAIPWSTGLYYHSAILLDNGKVLVAGGMSGTTFTNKAYLFDPVTRTWSTAGDMISARARAIAMKLPTGEVMVSAGTGAGNTYLSTSEIYTPGSNTWSAGPALNAPRGVHVATTLSDGRLLVVGSIPCAGCESRPLLFSPTSRTWSFAASPTTPRIVPAIAPLSSGRALVAGGGATVGTDAAAEIFNPSPAPAGSWSAVPNMPGGGRVGATAVQLADGRVLVTGGSLDNRPIARAELFDPSGNTWLSLPSMGTPRSDTAAVRLPSGRVLVVGGRWGDLSLSTAELFDPARLAWSAAGTLSTKHTDHSVTLTATGSVFVTSGVWADLYSPLAVGETCVAAGECASNACVDGVCCSTSTCGTGESCALPLKKGTCSKNNGTACSSATECGSGFCVDGVCCNSACAGQCQACNLLSARGTCSTVSGPTRGTRAPCENSPTDSCLNKTCDGVDPTKCNYFPAGTVACGAAGCTGGVETHASTCDGVGKCSDVPKACASYACDSTTKTCKTSCATATDCAAGSYCNAGVCAPLADLGKACSSTGGCTSGLTCVEGVCCASASCGSDETCASPARAGRCTRKIGAKCSVDDECASALCTDGVCCSARCDGQCEACDVTGRVGTCGPVQGAPRGARAACDPGTGDACSAKVCDGTTTTSCAAFVAAEVSCRTPACNGTRAIPMATCDGSGACPVAVETDCGAYACDPMSGTCRTTCASAAECASGSECVSSVCKPKTAVCSEDGTAVQRPDGTSQRCYPLRCQAGACVAKCTGTAECAAGFVCEVANGTCIAGTPSTAEEGGCAMGRSAAAQPFLLALLLAAGRLARRRR